MSENKKTFTIVAGPNGAGKTTFIKTIFLDLLKNKRFINADFIAQEISPDNVSQASVSAGRRFLKQLNQFIQEGDKSFIIETTLAGLTLCKKIKEAKSNNFQVNFIFLWISSLELCDFRVKGRVSMDGHNVPLNDIIRRYKRGLVNFNQYLPLLDECKVYLANEFPILIYDKSNQEKSKIIHSELYEQFQASITTAEQD